MRALSGGRSGSPWRTRSNQVIVFNLQNGNEIIRVQQNNDGPEFWGKTVAESLATTGTLLSEQRSAVIRRAMENWTRDVQEDRTKMVAEALARKGIHVKFEEAEEQEPK